MEIWKDISGYECKYKISNYGRIKSLNYGKTQKEKIRKTQLNKGYAKVNLSKNGKVKHYLVHRLVAEAFIPNPNNLTEINHKDENKENNHVSNLEWCTHKYNMSYGTRSEKVIKKLKGRKFTEDRKRNISKAMKKVGGKKIRCKNTGEVFNSINEARRKYGNVAIWDCCNRKRKSAGKHLVTGEKLVWEYLEETM